MTFRAWDVETTVKTKFKRKASPFNAGNWVVAQAYLTAAGAKETWYFGKTPPADGWLVDVLNGCKLLAGFNIKFDLLCAIYNQPKNLQAWMDFVVLGGMVWDCQLAEYLLGGMAPEEHMLSLNEVAVRYGGDLKVDEVKTLWEAGVDTHEIEPDLLMRYLAGDNTTEGDIGNTMLIAKGQIAAARERGQLQSIMLNMGALMATVEIERNGMYIDRELGEVLTKELEVVIADLRKTMEQFIPADLPFEFNWNSRFHKSALIFGGVVQWDAHEYDKADGGTVLKHEYEALVDKPDLVYAQKTVTKWLMLNGSTTDVDPSHAAADWSNYATFKSGKKEGEYKTVSAKVDNKEKPKGRSVKAPYKFAGFTTGKPEWMSSTPGVYSTSSEVIEALGNRDIPFLKTLAQLQSAIKDIGTYFKVTDPETGEEKGMLSLVGDDGIIHHMLNMCSTVTARLSSSNPNLQNVPKGKKSEVKRVFRSRFTDGVIIQSDFTALEVYVQACLTRCKQLIEDLRLGLDMHCVRVSQKSGKPYDEVLKLCKGYHNEAGEFIPAVKEWDEARTGAKVFSFQRAYGAGAELISESTGIPRADVDALIKAEEERYPEVGEYYANVTAEIAKARQRSGVVINHPTAKGSDGQPLLCHLAKSYYRTPDGKLYSYREHPAPDFLAKKGQVTSFSPTEIKNYVVQGSGGEWAKAAMWLALRAFYLNGNFGGRALLVNQVHDAMYADAAPDVKDQAAALLHACMEEASTYMEHKFGWKIEVPVPSDTTWGASMMDEAHIPGVKEAAKAYVQMLRKEFMNGYTPTFESK